MSNPNRKTSAQRKKEYRDRKRDEETFWTSVMGPIPDYLRDETTTFPDNLTDKLKTEEWERSPSHLVSHDLEDGPDATPYFDQHKHKAEVVAEAIDARTAEKVARISGLKLKYPEQWGKRGQAKVIAGLEADAGDRISVRTIQKYFAEDRANRRSRK